MWRSSGILWRSITGIFDGDGMRIHHEIVGLYEIWYQGIWWDIIGICDVWIHLTILTVSEVNVSKDKYEMCAFKVKPSQVRQAKRGTNNPTTQLTPKIYSWHVSGCVAHRFCQMLKKSFLFHQAKDMLCGWHRISLHRKPPVISQTGECQKQVGAVIISGSFV